MPHPPSLVRLPPALALAISLVLHLLVLLIPARQPDAPARPAKRLQASLQPPAPKVEAVVPQAPAKHKAEKPGRRILAMKPSQATAPSFPVPVWSEAEKSEMNEFLAETAREAKARPSLAQNALAMARHLGQQDEGEGETLERIPDSPPVDPLGLELYLDALVKKLNRSYAFVEDKRKKQGLKKAAVRVRLNPDGSLESLKVLNAADQQDEIAFIQAVVRQAAPFSPFPSDLKKSAKSLSMLICIKPPGDGAGPGFTRSSGKGC